ncbi:glycoside hydrolase family 43 protein [Nocardioides litoris]|uniref:glycoside hydrolase family 43 protein n=1 Tax=Nocardioides litoris TaxID=1926648 RepID=UPI0014769AC6|nr:glycoside hydrolase family 43 protein [Nocardioides litoris]
MLLRPRRRPALAGAVAAVVLALVAGCAGAPEGPAAPAPSTSAPSGPTAPPSEAAPGDPAALEDAEITTPPPPPESQVDNDLVRLAALAERIASRLPTQQRPAEVVVDGAGEAWVPGSTYRGAFADPDVVRADGRWWAYATNTSGRHVPTLVSDDLRTWTALGPDALPQVGPWVQGRGGGGGLWAPGVERIGDGWTLAYSAQYGVVGGQRHNCIGLARGTSPAGPFTHLGDPLACAPSSRQGVIDPDLYLDAEGRPWMLWKYSGEYRKRPAGIFSRQLNADGTDWAPGSQTFEILTFQGGWEGDTIENPSMVTFRDVTYLFYSGNYWTSADYATGYAICEGPAGPCGRPSPLPLLSTATTGHPGPGGATAIVTRDGRRESLRLVYHAWEPGRVGSLRRMRVAGLFQRPDLTLELVNAG